MQTPISLVRSAGRVAARGFACGLVLLFALSPGKADEPLKTTDDDPVVEKPAAPDATGEKTPGTAIDRKLLKALDSDESDSRVERLKKAIDAMRRAGKRIETNDTGAETTATQKEAIQDLEQLIADLRRAQQNRQNLPQPKNQNQNPDQERPDRQPLDQKQLDPQNSKKGSPPPGSSKGNSSERNKEEKSRDSQERTDPARALAEEEARRQQMLKDVWGHLPPHVREALRNSLSEKYVPKYEELIKRYYETLAEKNRKRSSKSPPPGF